MNIYLINRSLDQVEKCRDLIGDQYTPVDELVRKPGQKLYLWEARIARIRLHEGIAAQLLKDGLIKYMNKQRD